MPYIVIIFAIVICLLVYFMYKVLKKTVDKVNEQTKTYFVDKLQVYDELIEEKESKLKEIDEKIENKKAVLNSINDTSNKNNYTFDKNIIDIMTDADYKQNSASIHKKMDEYFNMDYDSIIKTFLSDNIDDKNYKILISIKEKFNSDKIYEISSSVDLKEAIINELNEEEKELVKDYIIDNNIKKIDDFLDYVDELILDNSPYIEIQVASSKENYDHLSKYIKTVVNDNIYKGIKILYKNKVYDYSLNERNV